jgi:small conductance mechanosensitive channel
MVVPNNEIWGNVITNITGMPTRRLDMVFGIAYSDDAEKAMGILDEVVRAHPLTLPEPEPTIKLHELGNSSVDLICRPWVKTSDYWALRWDVIKTVKERFDKEGITIPFPQRDVHIFQESGA